MVDGLTKVSVSDRNYLQHMSWMAALPQTGIDKDPASFLALRMSYAVRDERPLYLFWDQRALLVREQPRSVTLPGVPNNKGE